ncbi:DoxX family protein [Adhaeribacter rhizoryzae]|uniref:DoxX family protein n=1 Tax=Adhaeribacter rhizoryzae TaxID=2607907 RepID=A0A5M6CY50_9BACT|nr:DoxX family protein [Adhaeribacter rhizoryzae]KAA5540148.1 DoxX family protein [Adhaeribacter rhizoryzae]
MELTHRIGHWADTHHPAWLDLIRMGLGTFILFKGLVFISDISVLERLLININLDWSSFIFAHYIAFAHLVGGILIALGLVTRAAILFQLPILLGAVLFVHSDESLRSINTEWWVSALTLFLLIVFFIYGSGPWSLDQYMRTHRER